MNWNFNINEAPKGWEEVKTIKRKDKDIDVSVHNPEYIWAASSCGVVTKSYWIESEGRWCCFKKGENPIAWQIFEVPFHPNLKASN